MGIEGCLAGMWVGLLPVTAWRRVEGDRQVKVGVLDDV